MRAVFRLVQLAGPSTPVLLHVVLHACTCRIDSKIPIKSGWLMTGVIVVPVKAARYRRTCSYWEALV